jgi:catechol 2,3-dioxygenase-like lactoylglutathione lyase family enzyme
VHYNNGRSSADTPLSITNLEKVTFGVTDMPTSERFWTEFGLERRVDAATGAVSFAARDGSGVELRAADDPALPPAVEAAPTIREATFGVESQAALDALVDELGTDREVTVDADHTAHTTDPLGFPIAFRVSRRTPVTAPAAVFNTPGRPDRINTRGRFFDSARPLELTHTVYMIDDPDTVVPFYTERLGFLVSDCYPGRGYFLRGGASNHHHDLFLLNVGGKRGYHHCAFELSTIHELFGGGLNMTRRGWETALGPGRHPISSCYFWYFKCPSGGAAEYDFDSDQVDEHWIPGTFEQTPENFAEWCLAAGMQESLLYKGIQSSRTAEKE